MYKLEIAAKISIERFIDNVKLLTERKQKRLERLKDIYKNKGSKRCKNMPNIYFERIIQNKDIGEQKVYGINALHNHTFLANNFITHNTNASSVYIGTAWYQKSRYYQMLTTLPDTHKVIVPYQRALEERKKKYDETLDPIHLNYAKHIRKEIAKLGEDGDAFKTQYALKWILERGQFITEEVLLVLENTEKEDPPLFVGRGEVCYAGIDWGKSNDSTVMTVVNDKHQIIYWLEFNGDDYYSQILAIMEVIKAKFHGMKAIYCDSTGSQDQAVDNLRGRLRENGLYINTIPVTFTQASKDMMYRNLFSLMHDKKMGAIVMETAKLRYPKRQCVEKEKFISQFLILQKEVKNGFWKCHHPDGDYHDDYPDSLALACLAYGGLTKQYSPVVG